MGIKYDDLVKQLKAKQYAPVYLLMGEEPFYIDRLCKFFENNVIDGNDRDFNQVTLYGKDTDAAEIIANARQYPFGSPWRLVIVKEAKELKGLDQLKPYVEHPADSTILVICHKYGKLRANQCKPYEKRGVVFESAAVKDWNLPDWVQKQAAFFKFRLSPVAANIITEHIGNNLSRIYNEFEKLQIVLPENAEITPDIIEKHVGISKEYNIFELQEALGMRNAPKVYKIVLNFAQHLKENPNIRTISMLFSFYGKMLMYHLASDTSPETLRTIYGNLPPSVMARNVRYAQIHNVGQIVKIISVLREYDVRAKGVDSNTGDGDLLMEMTRRILG